MSGINPILPLILASGRGTPSSPENPAKVAQLQAMCTTTPALINTVINALDVHLPMDTALSGGFWPAVKALVAAGATAGVVPRVAGGSMLGQAAFSANPALVQWVWSTGLDQGLDPQVGVQALSATVVIPDERLQVVQFLVGKGLVVNGDMAVLAARSTDRRIPSFLVTTGALGTLLIASIESLIKPLENPLGYALLPDKTNGLYCAVHTGAPDAVVAEIATGSPVNITLDGASRLGTPLHYALWLGFVSCAAALMDAGADPALLSSWGQSIVGAAAVSGNVDGVRFALGVAPPTGVNQVERNFVSGRDAAPIVAAIFAKPPAVVDVVHALLQGGADPNNAACSGVPCAFWPSYQLQAPSEAHAAGFTAAKAKAIILDLAAGNNKGQKADLDAYNAAARNTARGLAKQQGIIV